MQINETWKQNVKLYHYLCCFSVEQQIVAVWEQLFEPPAACSCWGPQPNPSAFGLIVPASQAGADDSDSAWRHKQALVVQSLHGYSWWMLVLRSHLKDFEGNLLMLLWMTALIDSWIIKMSDQPYNLQAMLTGRDPRAASGRARCLGLGCPEPVVELC